jgi:hypothetical protein
MGKNQGTVLRRDRGDLPIDERGSGKGYNPLTSGSHTSDKKRGFKVRVIAGVEHKNESPYLISRGL